MLIKKLLVIIITALALTSSLYARGVTENVAREGVKGISTYLEDLGKAGKDERIPEAKREEVVEKVYSGMTFEEAAKDYIKKDESTSKPSPQPSLPVNAEESELVKVETVQPLTEEETAPVTAPQMEEEKIQAPIEEKQPEMQQVEESADEGIVYSYTLDYKGVRSEIRAYSTYAVVTVPEGMTEEDIMAVKDMLVAQYPAEAALVTYKLEGDTLTLMYPEQSSEFIIAVVNALRYEAVALIDSLSSQPELEEVPTEGGHVYAGTLSYKGLSTTITLDNTMATLTVPAGIEKDDIDAVAYIVSATYPEESSLVTYSFENGVLTLYYPEQTDEFLLSSLNDLKEGGMYLVDLYGKVETAVAAAAETVIETVNQADDAVSISEEDNGPVYSETLTYRGVTSSVVVDKTYASFTIPAGMDKDDIEAVAELVNYLYPAEASLLTYSIDEDTLTVTYPEQRGEFLLSALTVLREEAVALIDDILAHEETAVAEAPAVEKGAVYEDTLYYKNVTSKVAVYNTYAVLTLPEGTGASDVKAVADMIAVEYKEAALVTYTLDGNTLTLSYPEQSDAFLLGAVKVLRAEADAYIDSLDKTVVKAEAPVEAPAAPAETTVPQEATSPVDATAPHEVAAVSSPLEETEKTVTGVLSSPSAVLEKKKGGVFSYDITLSLKGKFVFYKGSDHIYPTLSFSMRDTFEESFYLEAGVDVLTYINSDKLFAVAGMNLNAGFNVPINNFDFYFYTGLRYQLASKSASFKSGLSVTVGTGIDWRINDHLITGVGYEYYGSASLFSFFLKYRF